MSSQIQALKDRLATVSDLASAAELAGWDQQTKMPVNGAQARAAVLETLASLTHALFIDDETGRLLEAAAAAGSGLEPDSDDARLIAVARRRYDKARRVPAALAGEQAKAGSEGQEAWIAAREASSFSSFAPYLERNLELTRRYVDCHLGHDGYTSAYDVLIDDYEPAIKTTHVAELFSELKSELVPMIATLAQAEPVDDGPLRVSFATDGQRALTREIVGLMGFDERGWRMDDTVHPFATGIGSGDVRITTRWDESYWPMSLYGAMHECGHGLYEDGIAPELRRTPIGQTESLALHESQSRLWENMVGRGRPFADVLAPRLARHGGPEITPDALYRAVNSVKPSFIRVEADEATYALHIILRFELEQELVEGRLAVADLPEAWNARFAEYFGLQVPDDAHGVLQDVHWSAGMIGYFPTYALGNLIAGQLWVSAHSEIDRLDDQLAAGELGQLREWLRLRVHRHGAKFETEELLTRAGGGPISVAPFVRYLRTKLSDVYGVELGD